MTNRLKRIVIIEDNEEVVANFVAIIGQTEAFMVTGHYDNCEEAIAALPETRPDIVLMDIMLAGAIDGVEGTRLIKRKLPDADVIMVTIFEDSDLVFEALKAGASGYITKSSGTIELRSALEEISIGGAPMSSRIARMVIRNYQKRCR